MKRDFSLKLSIIVPVYNVEKYLERCVDSLLHQDIDKSEYEIILINDGSTDRSFEIAQQLKRKHPNIVLLSQENKGQSAARNVGLNIAKGKYILFVDSDDFIECNVVGKLIELSERNSLDLCFFHDVFDYGNGSPIEKRKQRFSENVIYDGEELILNNIEVSVVWLNMYSSDFLFGTGIKFVEGIIHEDVIFDYMLYPLAKRVMFSDIVVYHYCVYDESSIRTENPEKVRKIIESDFYVAKQLQECSLNKRYSKAIRKFYSKVKNSTVVSGLIQLANSKKLKINAKLECLDTAKSLGVYPIKGITQSWKTTILGHVLNFGYFCRYFITRNGL